ncbi:hypothetical protein B0T25DRAFT_578572 [Lasiosphaeria hispida]|uniref:Uncharacterized protein n=1 Tax=Lasiosphaeria hispida TaxID=260671 RepID=A0AAJ0HSL9_9PEZI|nr:hypothetical protein B0T25DRAFT_578572 [Lasiosphaeria hispida]
MEEDIVEREVPRMDEDLFLAGLQPNLQDTISSVRDRVLKPLTGYTYDYKVTALFVQEHRLTDAVLRAFQGLLNEKRGTAPGFLDSYAAYIDQRHRPVVCGQYVQLQIQPQDWEDTYVRVEHLYKEWRYDGSSDWSTQAPQRQCLPLQPPLISPTLFVIESATAFVTTAINVGVAVSAVALSVIAVNLALRLPLQPVVFGIPSIFRARRYFSEPHEYEIDDDASLVLRLRVQLPWLRAFHHDSDYSEQEEQYTSGDTSDATSGASTVLNHARPTLPTTVVQPLELVFHTSFLPSPDCAFVLHFSRDGYVTAYRRGKQCEAPYIETLNHFIDFGNVIASILSSSPRPPLYRFQVHPIIDELAGVVVGYAHIPAIMPWDTADVLNSSIPTIEGRHGDGYFAPHTYLTDKATSMRLQRLLDETYSLVEALHKNDDDLALRSTAPALTSCESPMR